MQHGPCPACDEALNLQRSTGGDRTYFDCPTCGRFELDGTAVACLPSMRQDDPRINRVLSYAIRQRYESGQVPRLSVALINEIAANTALPTVAVQADNFILWIGDHLVAGEVRNFTAREYRSVIGSGSVSEFTLVGRHLIERGLLDRGGSHKDGVLGALSFAGWERYEVLKGERIPMSSEPESTGWQRVDRSLDKMRAALGAGRDEEDFQHVGLLGRETLISLAQAVFDRERHEVPDGVDPSDTDAGRMLEGYIATEMGGGANKYARKYARASLDLAVSLQHRRTATFRDAALCYESTASVVRSIAIVSGRRDPEH